MEVGRREQNEQLLFNGYKVSVMQFLSSRDLLYGPIVNATVNNTILVTNTILYTEKYVKRGNLKYSYYKEGRWAGGYF